ncbi:hypothetical protein ACWDBD_48755 [Streptomyces sp. NPDC001118]
MIESFADPSVMNLEQLKAEVAELVRADELSARRWACEVPGCDGLPHEGWLHHHARAAQRQPSWLWTVWMLLTGRDWGTSWTAAETVREWAKTPGLHIAVVAKNATLVRDICFGSPKSGLLSVIPPEDVAKYNSSLSETTLRLKNSTLIRGFGAETPDNLRGWAFDKAWCDPGRHLHDAQATPPSREAARRARPDAGESAPEGRRATGGGAHARPRWSFWRWRPIARLRKLADDQGDLFDRERPGAEVPPPANALEGLTGSRGGDVAERGGLRAADRAPVAGPGAFDWSTLISFQGRRRIRS